jgi:hypothetical protein
MNANCPDTTDVRELRTFLDAEMKSMSQPRVHLCNPEAVRG